METRMLPGMPIRVGTTGMHPHNGSAIAVTHEMTHDGSTWINDGETRWVIEWFGPLPMPPVLPVPMRLKNRGGRLVRQTVPGAIYDRLVGRR